MLMVKFVSDITAQAIVTFAVGLVSGAGGFAGIKAFLLRPKVRYATHSVDLVNSVDPAHKQRVEAILSEQGLATALTEIVWRNTGRRSARALVLEVLTKTGYVGYQITPTDPNATATAWTLEESDSTDGHRLRIRQETLFPNSMCKLTVEHHLSGCLPEVTFFHGDRIVSETTGPGEDNLTVPGVLVTLGAMGFVLMGFLMLLFPGDDFIEGGAAALLITATVFGIAYWLKKRISRTSSPKGATPR
ncbi:MAG TPA: hypothetical protein VF092_27255 [Longimicrobium sp.]